MKNSEVDILNKVSDYLTAIRLLNENLTQLILSAKMSQTPEFTDELSKLMIGGKYINEFVVTPDRSDEPKKVLNFLAGKLGDNAIQSFEVFGTITAIVMNKDEVTGSQIRDVIKKYEFLHLVDYRIVIFNQTSINKLPELN